MDFENRAGLTDEEKATIQALTSGEVKNWAFGRSEFEDESVVVIMSYREDVDGSLTTAPVAILLTPDLARRLTQPERLAFIRVNGPNLN